MSKHDNFFYNNFFYVNPFAYFADDDEQRRLSPTGSLVFYNIKRVWILSLSLWEYIISIIYNMSKL